MSEELIHILDKIKEMPKVVEEKREDLERAYLD